MIFKTAFRITQRFGEHPENYKQYGFAGHEGLDLIPSGTDWSIFAPEDGEVLRDYDTVRDNYGVMCVIWNKEKRRAWWFCHLAENLIALKETVKKGQKIGIMGSTGNSTGPHLHLGLRYSDENATAINLNNGYKGFVDPLPVLGELMDEPMISIPVKDRDFLVSRATVAKDTVLYLGITDKHDEADRTPIETIKKSIDGLRGYVSRASVAEQEVKNREEQVSRLNDQLLDKEKAILALTDKLNATDPDQKKLIQTLQDSITALTKQNNELAKAKGTALNELAVLKASQEYTVLLRSGKLALIKFK